MKVSNKIRYVLTEDNEVKQHSTSKHWRAWLFLIIFSVSGLLGFVVFNEFTSGAEVEAVAEEIAIDVPMFDVAGYSGELSCTDYVEAVDDCTEVSIEGIKENGCGYYYELQIIGSYEYASACYCIVGTDSCARYDDCQELLGETEDGTVLNIVKESLSCTDWTEEVDDCTAVNITEIKTNGCEYYYQVETIDGEEYASACYCVVGTDSCAVNDDCEELLEDTVDETMLKIGIESLSCTDYTVEVDDCTAVNITEIKSNGCEYYYEVETIDGEEYASACYCVVGTDSCAVNEDCEELLEDIIDDITLKIVGESLSCTEYTEEVDDCTTVTITEIKSNGCEYYYEAETIDGDEYASACYCVVGTDSCAVNDDCEELIENTVDETMLKVATMSLSCTEYTEEVDDCTAVNITEIKTNGCEYYYEVETIDGEEYASACYCVVGTDSCAVNDDCEELLEETADQTMLNIASELLSCTDYTEEVDDCTTVSVAKIKANGCEYYYEVESIDGDTYASACYCVVGSDSCDKNDDCGELLESTIDKTMYNIAIESLSCTDYTEEVNDCTEVDIDKIKTNGCEYYYEAKTINDVQFATACYCVVGTDSCARNEDCEVESG